jgi:hypothetical protein
MKGLARLAIWLYRRIIAFYPRPYRDMFASEMQAIFTSLAAEAARRGPLVLAGLLLKEIGGLLVGVVREQAAAFYDRRWTMNDLRRYRGIGWSLLLSIVLPTLITLLLTGERGWLMVLGWVIFFGGLYTATLIATRGSALDCADWLRRLWKRS